MRLSKNATVSLEGDRTVLLNCWPCLMRAKTDYTQVARPCQAGCSLSGLRLPGAGLVLGSHKNPPKPPFADLHEVLPGTELDVGV